MTTTIKVPDFPESVTDGTIVAWHKQPGEQVKRDEPLVDIETDKVMFEVPAPEDGVLEKILEQENAVVVSGQEIAAIRPLSGSEAAQAAAPPTEPADNHEEPVITPSARKLIDEQGLDPARIKGTGKGGRILKEDVLRHQGVIGGGEAAPEKAEPPVAPPSPTPAPEAPVPASPRRAGAGREERRVPMTRLRSRIAERLVEAQHTAAILTTFNEVDMQAVMALRQNYREKFERAHGVRLGFMSFFVKASVEALKRFPMVNASIDGGDIVYHGYFDVGVAIGAPRGLVVPILRDADSMSVPDIEKKIIEYSDKAKQGKISLDEITGGTFTITNGGVFGSLLSTPILNPPQSAILGMHKIEQRAVVREGEIVIRPMMYLALSYDHRIIDGREAVQFLVTIKELLEDPARMLIGV